jgi:hypothetical protein
MKSRRRQIQIAAAAVPTLAVALFCFSAAQTVIAATGAEHRGFPHVSTPLTATGHALVRAYASTDQVVEIVSDKSGKCLDDTNWSTRNGAAMQQWSCSGRLNQEWDLHPVGRHGWDEIINAYSHKCLDDTNWSWNNGNKIQQWSCFGYHLNQQWFIFYYPGNQIDLLNGYSADALEINGNESNQRDPSDLRSGDIVDQWQLWGGSNQGWHFRRPRPR